MHLANALVCILQSYTVKQGKVVWKIELSLYSISITKFLCDIFPNVTFIKFKVIFIVFKFHLTACHKNKNKKNFACMKAIYKQRNENVIKSSRRGKYLNQQSLLFSLFFR